MARSNITSIIGYVEPLASAPTDLDERMVWIEKNIRSTYRTGKWNVASCEAIAAKMGIVDGLKIKHI